MRQSLARVALGSVAVRKKSYFSTSAIGTFNAFVELIQGLVVVGGAVYIASIAWLLRGLYRLVVERMKPLCPSLTIIVAARNEEAVLEGCFRGSPEAGLRGRVGSCAGG